MIQIRMNSCAPLVILSAAKDLGCERKKSPIRWPDPSVSPQDDKSLPRIDLSECE